MDHRLADRIAAIALACAVAGLAAWMPASAGAKELPPIESFRADLLDIQNHLTNVSMKLKLDLRGGAAPEELPDRELTPGEACCWANIKTIRAKLHHMNETVGKLRLHFIEVTDTTGLAAVDRIVTEMNAVAIGVSHLQVSKEIERARRARIGLTKPFNRLRAAVDALEECCPVKKLKGQKPKPPKRKQ